MRIASFTAVTLCSFIAVLAVADGGQGADAGAVQSAPAPNGQAVYLVRSTLLALDAANRTGNYTVLRDLATPAFQQRNGPEDLARIFSELPRRDLDLAAIALHPPAFSLPPVPDERNRLRLRGKFEPEGGAVEFDLTFGIVDGHWRLAEIAIAPGTRPQG